MDITLERCPTSPSTSKSPSLHHTPKQVPQASATQVQCVLYLGKEHWIGLNNMYDLTTRPNLTMQLRVTMEDFSNVKKVAYYNEFYLNDSVWLH
jgi:hypothetical protein